MYCCLLKFVNFNVSFTKYKVALVKLLVVRAQNLPPPPLHNTGDLCWITIVQQFQCYLTINILIYLSENKKS